LGWLVLEDLIVQDRVCALGGLAADVLVRTMVKSSSFALDGWMVLDVD